MCSICRPCPTAEEHPPPHPGDPKRGTRGPVLCTSVLLQPWLAVCPQGKPLGTPCLSLTEQFYHQHHQHRQRGAWLTQAQGHRAISMLNRAISMLKSPCCCCLDSGFCCEDVKVRTAVTRVEALSVLGTSSDPPHPA